MLLLLLEEEEDDAENNRKEKQRVWVEDWSNMLWNVIKSLTNNMEKEKKTL